MSQYRLPDAPSEVDHRAMKNESGRQDWMIAFAVALVALAVYLAILGLHIQSVERAVGRPG